MKEAAEAVLLAVGYPIAILVIARWIPVVRERRTRWFVAELAAVGAIVAGWALAGNDRAIAVNGTWLVVAAVWYGLGGRGAASEGGAQGR